MRPNDLYRHTPACDPSPRDDPMASFVEAMIAGGTTGQSIESRILEVRGQQVMLEADLARLHGVPVETLGEAVSRNSPCFPPDFVFQLVEGEVDSLRSQIVAFGAAPSGEDRDSSDLPRAFTEEGVAMLSSVLNTDTAAQVSVEIMRAFVRLRGSALNHAGLSRRLDALESKSDRQFTAVFDAIRQLKATPAAEPRRGIGFVQRE